MANGLTLWKPQSELPLPSETLGPKEIVVYASQLNEKDRRQIVSAFDSGHYEMGLNFVWLRTSSALKKELASVGVSLLGEMVGRVGLSDDDDVDDVLTISESIRVARELGVVTPTQALRLQHTHELVNHFNQIAVDGDEFEEMDQAEAVNSLKSCIAVLAKERVEVARPFIEFREALDTESFASDQERQEMLIASPYFFRKLTVDILMNSSKDLSGAKLEHCLANMNVLVPKMWSGLRDPEKWRIGRTYAEAYTEGRKTSTAGLRRALEKVQGFDFVPENLRSDTFLKAAEAILRAHDGFNNFYNEPAPTKALGQLGTSIPIPALAGCMTALLSVHLGNRYGHSFLAAEHACSVLDGVSPDRWQYYLNQVLPYDVRVLQKLEDDKPCKRWIECVNDYNLGELELKGELVPRLVKAASGNDGSKVKNLARRMTNDHYGSK